MRVLYYSLVCVLSFLAHVSDAQVSLTTQEQCATMVQDSISRARFPKRGSLLEFENFVQDKIEEIRLLRASGRSQAGVISIPIVVHIVHNGEAVGTGTNLSLEQIQAQIAVLNEDFRRKEG